MISQVTAVKPVIVGVAFTGGDLIFPLSYLLGDVLTEYMVLRAQGWSSGRA